MKRSAPAIDCVDDPLGLAAMEAELAWPTEGPLPSWLDGTDLSTEAAPRSMPSPAPILAESRVETLADVENCEETRPEVPVDPDKPSSSFEELLNLVHMVSSCSSGRPIPNDAKPAASSSQVLDADPFGEASSWAQTAKGGRVPTRESINLPIFAAERNPSTRRVPTLDELAEARECLLVEAADRLWAIPLPSTVRVGPRSESGANVDVDLALEAGGGPERRPRGKRWIIETESLTVGVDVLRGLASIAWSIAEGDAAPFWTLAQASHRGQSVGLVDLETWSRIPVTAARSDPAAEGAIPERCESNPLSSESSR
jgi:hypothetical protein